MVSFSVAANPNTSSRSGTITAAGETFTITQPGVSCSYSLSAASHTATADGGAATVGVTTVSGCGWSAFTDQPWISITGGETGTESGTVSFTVAANTSPAPRTGQIAVAGHVFTVDQAAAACSYVLSSAGSSVAAAGGTGSFTLTSGTGCPWTAQTSASWLAVTSPASGSGPVTVTFSAAANTDTSPRSATITIAGETYAVSQAAGACSVTTSTSSASLGASGGIGLIFVTAATTCSWAATSQASWITITAGGVGSGNANVSYTVAANPDTTARTGTISVGGRTFTVNQAAAPCGFTLSPTSQAAVAAGGAYSVNVTTTSGCAWTASSNVPWITVSGSASRTGSGPVNYTVSPNAGSFTRSGSLTIAGRFFSVSQAANSCSVTVTPTSISASYSGGQVSVTIATGSGCNWTVATTTPWITVLTPTGSGSGLATVRLAANSGTQVRTGSFTVGGVTISVSQGIPLSAPQGLRIVSGGGGQ
jgi:hypothetical protein